MKKLIEIQDLNFVELGGKIVARKKTWKMQEPDIKVADLIALFGDIGKLLSPRALGFMLVYPETIPAWYFTSKKFKRKLVV